MSRRDYTTRGEMSLTWAICSVIGAVLSFVRFDYVGMAVDLSSAAWFGFRFWEARRKTRKQWEEEYGVFDERDAGIDLRATRVTLAVGSGAMFVLCQYVFTETKEQLAFVGVGVLCIIAYLVAKRVYEKRM